MSQKIKLSIFIASIIIVAMYIVNQQINDLSKQQIITDQSLLLTEMSRGMASRLGQDMNSRAAEIEFLTKMNLIRDQEVSLIEKKNLFEEMKKSYPYYAWIGITDSQGNILAGTDDLLVGKNVAKRTWFIEGSKGLHFGDAHDAFLLAKLMPKPKWDDLPLRLVDVSAPVKDENGNLLGVICGHLSVDWAFEARLRMLANPEKESIDLIVLNDKGKVLMGTPFLPSLKTDLSSLKAWKDLSSKESMAHIEQWPDGANYLTSIVSKDAIQSRLAINWAIVARKPESDLYSSTSEIQTTIVSAGLAVLILSLIFIWLFIQKQNDQQ